ncbi:MULTISPECIES: tRNA epoxyqueuosine(34) reductase QueG [Rhodomicrobium]|uniref:tRNA epoxyqueuosine(34) reductase QueG n=1 Tax=Rhodomicrobium TaxID=1068 RepID=UPI000B4C0C99|nr:MULTISPECIES: tRNA epoxyqueuosine(34) reductase QueG [Rhodomicrobium]
MPVNRSDAVALKAALIARAGVEGFDALGIARPDGIGRAGEHLAAFLAEGMHGDMSWLEAESHRRRHPSALWPQARSIIMLGLNYGPETDPLKLLEQRWRGAVSAYARGRDYHDVVKGKLKILAGWLHRASGAEVKVFVDTAPVMEKPLAQAAGLGWQGKHTNLVSRELGSWLFLGAIFTTADLPPDRAESDHCGSCRNCLDICPTSAFPAPYRLDARRCISYLTIEHKGHIGREFREAMGNRIYGCDDCLAVCPWNKFAAKASEAKFAARPLTDGAPLSELLALDDASFRAAFSGSPVKRTGRDRFIRNVLIAAGNSGEPALVPKVTALLGDPSPLVRAMAVWAARRLLDGDPLAAAALRERHLPAETDAEVRREWDWDESRFTTGSATPRCHPRDSGDPVKGNINGGALP